MACFMNAIAVVIFSLFGVVRGEVKVEKDDNIEPFSLLCRIYNVAKNPPINYVDMEEGYNIVEEIDDLNTSLVEQKWVNQTEQVGDDEVTGKEHAKISVAVTKETALAQLSLNQITQSVHTVLEEIKKMKVTKKIEKTKDEFVQVIFGEGGNEDDLCHSTVKGVVNRSEARGNPGAGTNGSHAGKNLVVDFFCLCVRSPEEEGVNQVCGFYVGIKNGVLGWNESKPMGSSTMWASIKGGCGKHMHQHPKSTAEARHILDQFLKHLKTGGVYRWVDGSGKVQGSNRKEGMLGTGVGKEDDGGGPVCDGKNGKKGRGTPAGGICVYDGPESDNWEANIAWLKKLKTALASVDAANNQTATIQGALQKL
ncbi:unnamed protein product [Trypanosoma congolense IL3000]|uniref:WGS project CAEQ00000000 data, annotated contig 2051 n=1 Tax=Trypanosoma congolense (strain IL3000) TaxID=1068625 RepID=F9WB27_TRYCI|nr:unnamed protein product [Trypanosoma congolense IL3000]